MEKTLFALSLGFAGVILATQAGWAAPQCAAREEVVKVLANKYGEARGAIGLNGADRVMEMFINPTTGTWTITVTMSNGQTCLIASGDNFEPVTEALPAKGDPT